CLSEALGAEIGAERSGDEHAAILLLMVLQNRGDDTRKRQSRSVQGVNETRLPAARRLVADIRAARLEVGEVAAGGNLEPLADAGGLDLEIVGVCAREAVVSGR